MPGDRRAGRRHAGRSTPEAPRRPRLPRRPLRASKQAPMVCSTAEYWSAYSDHSSVKKSPKAVRPFPGVSRRHGIHRPPPFASRKRPYPSHRRGADLRHRQLRRHFRARLSGGQGGGPQPRAHRLVGLVDLDRRGRHGDISQLGDPRAHHHGMVHTRGRVSGDGPGDHVLRRSHRRVSDLGGGVRRPRPVRMLRARHPTPASPRACWRASCCNSASAHSAA